MNRVVVLALVFGTACGSSAPSEHTAVTRAPPRPTGPSLDTARIVIVGASVSAGFGGTPFGDAFKAAAKPPAVVESVANTFLFRDPVGESTVQVDRALELRATTVVAIDYLFWDIYGSTDSGWRDDALARGLANLERARASGAWIVVGDVPRIVTAAELMIPRANVPDEETLARYNAQIATWAKHERVLFVPFAAWAAPLATNGMVEIAPGERVEASALVAADGLHTNPLGTWFLLDKLDHFIESALPGTPADALVFARPI